MIGCGCLNVMIERVAYRPLRSAPKLAPLITAVGFSFILQNVGLLWLGGSHVSVPDLIESQKVLFTILGVPITHGDVLAVAATTPLRDPARRRSSRTAGWARRCAPPRRTRKPPA